MILKQMTDYVLEKQGKVLNSELGLLSVNYAKFLKTPLNLGMFFPCDEEYVLTEPECECTEDEYCNFGYFLELYEKAEEKVLFKNIDLDAAKHHISQNRDIEYLSRFNLVELTDNAVIKYNL